MLFRNRFISFVLAGSVAIAALGSAPASAQDLLRNPDFWRFAAGAAAIGIIAKTLDDQANDKRAKKRREEALRQDQAWRHTNYRNAPPRFRQEPPRRGWDRHNARDLPKVCGQRIRTERGPRIVYDPKCLRHHGYSVARHRN